MGLTRIEALLDKAVSNNTTILPVVGRDNVNPTCDVVVQTGPVRLATKNPQEFRGLAAAALNGSSVKQIVPVSPAASGTLTNIDLTEKCCAYLLRISGALNTFRRAPIQFGVSAGAGFTDFTFTVYPHDTVCEVLVIITQLNSGLGQVAVNNGTYRLVHLAANTNAAGEYVVAIESINMREFTDRSAN